MAFITYPKHYYVWAVFAFTLMVFVLLPRKQNPSMMSCPVEFVQDLMKTAGQGEKNNGLVVKNLQHDTGSGKVLVLSPFKEAGAFVESYFSRLNKTTYPKHLLNVGLIISDSTDGTLETVTKVAQNYSFGSVKLFMRDFEFNLTWGDRHNIRVQQERRDKLARSRNTLLSAALEDDVEWVAWLDADVVRYPASIFEDLISVNEDVVVPNCMLDNGGGDYWGYDRNNWRDTNESRELIKKLNPTDILYEGYAGVDHKRILLVNMPMDKGKMYKEPLDSVGATFTLVRANVHRLGAVFPSYPFMNAIETEGFGRMAKAMGFSIYGLPGYIILHAKKN